MLEDERLEKILGMLKDHKIMTNAELCKKLFCSSSTLRRDLIKLENNGLVKRSHGYVRNMLPNNIEFSFNSREHEKALEKEYIASLAYNLILENQSLFLDSSSTVNKLCNMLKNRQLVVVTNGIKNISILNQFKSIDLFVIGGSVKVNSLATVGAIGANFLDSFHADVAFISCFGLGMSGLFEVDTNQAIIKKKMMENSKKVVVLCDDSKFDLQPFYKSATYDQIDLLITNKQPKAEFLEMLSSFGCECIW